MAKTSEKVQALLDKKRAEMEREEAAAKAVNIFGMPIAEGAELLAHDPEEEEDLAFAEAKPRTVYKVLSDFSISVNGTTLSYVRGEKISDPFILGFALAAKSPLQEVNNEHPAVCPECAHEFSIRVNPQE